MTEGTRPEFRNSPPYVRVTAGQVYRLRAAVQVEIQDSEAGAQKLRTQGTAGARDGLGDVGSHPAEHIQWGWLE